MRLLTAAEGGSRLLSLLFYIIAARVLSPSGFGVVRYTITFSLIMFLALQVLVKAIARELGAARGDERLTRSIIGSSLLLTAVVLAVSYAACFVVVGTGLSGLARTWPLIVVLSGQAGFQVYYALGRGLGHMARPALTYLAGSLLQLLALLVYGAIATRVSPGAALIIFGISSLAPIVAYELWRPILRRQSLLVSRHALGLLWATSAPLVLGQVAFVVWNSADQVWVQERFGAVDVGLYSASRNLVQLFLVLPTGIGAALLPRVAELRARGEERRAVRLVGGATGAVLTVSSALGLAAIIGRTELLELCYGRDYRAAAPALVGLTVGMAVAAVYFTLSAASVGWGRGVASTFAFSVGAAVELSALLLLRPTTPAGTAWTFALSSAASCLCMVGLAIVAYRDASGVGDAPRTAVEWS